MTTEDQRTPNEETYGWLQQELSEALLEVIRSVTEEAELADVYGGSRSPMGGRDE